MPAYWTESGSDKVKRTHFQPDKVDTSGADLVAAESEVPQRPDVEPWVSVTLHYNDKDGLYYKTEDPFEGLNLTDTEKSELFEAIERRDLVKARNIVEKALSK